MAATRIPTMLTPSHSANTQHTSRSALFPAGKRALSLTATLLVGALGLTACGPGYDDPNDAAEQLGNQLESDQLAGFEGASLSQDSADPAAIVESAQALMHYPRSVTLDSVAVDDQDQTSDDEVVTATAQYTITWNLSGQTATEDEETQDDSDDTDESKSEADDEWSYTTEASLIWDEEADTWQPQLEADTLVPGLVDGGQVVVDVDAAPRGDILDTHGEPLATERPVYRIGIDKLHVLNQLSDDGTDPTEEELEEALTSSATELAESLELDPEPFVERVLTAGERAWVEFIVLRDDEETEVPLTEISDILGAIAREDSMVLGPTSTFARSLLGTYGQPTAEQVENSDGEFTAGIATGLSGLQRTYNDQLSGTDGVEIFVDNSAADGSPDSTPVEFSRDVTAGTAITTTLDTRIQELAEQSTRDAEEPAGMVVVRPSDGHILAAADGPEDLTWPLAMTASYAPGSTFKVVTALAMLRNGMTPDSTVSCPETLNVGGLEISNFEYYPSEFVGDITLADAIAQSCNTAFVGQHQDISPQQEHHAAAALGLVPEPVVGFDGARLGTVPTDVEGTTHAAGLFGQGAVEASPLGMATVAASVAAGQTVTPILVAEPSVDPTDNDHLPVEEPLTDEEAEQLRELMTGPVESGTVPILQEVPGSPVLAKTGTAESEADGEAVAHTWLIATQDDIAVSLFFHDGIGGAQTNGPVLQEFLTELNELTTSD